MAKDSEKSFLEYVLRLMKISQHSYDKIEKRLLISSKENLE